MEDNEIRTYLINRRKELGLSQEYMAGQLDISITSYRKIENGKTNLYNKKVLRLAEILGTSPARLLFGYAIRDEETGILKEEYEKDIVSLTEKNAELRERIRTLEELLASKAERIPMLKTAKTKN